MQLKDALKGPEAFLLASGAFAALILAQIKIRDSLTLPHNFIDEPSWTAPFIVLILVFVFVSIADDLEAISRRRKIGFIIAFLLAGLALSIFVATYLAGAVQTVHTTNLEAPKNFLIPYSPSEGLLDLRKDHQSWKVALGHSSQEWTPEEVQREIDEQNRFDILVLVGLIAVARVCFALALLNAFWMAYSKVLSRQSVAQAAEVEIDAEDGQ